jgi:hypothetical protein
MNLKDVDELPVRKATIICYEISNRTFRILAGLEIGPQAQIPTAI